MALAMKIFVVFFNNEIANKGLGLTGIKSRIAKLNGHLDIDSMPNRGSIFNINIPHK